MPHEISLFYLGFIGLRPPSLPSSSRIMKHLRSLWGQQLLPMQTGRPFTFPECTVQIIRESLELTQKQECFSLALHRHYIAFTELRWWWVRTRMQYFSRTTGGTTCQWSVEVAEDLQGWVSLCCDVVPLRDLDLVTTFNAASFCVAFFLLYCIWKS